MCLPKILIQNVGKILAYKSYQNSNKKKNKTKTIPRRSWNKKKKKKLTKKPKVQANLLKKTA